MMNESQARRAGIMVVMSSWLAVFMLFGVRSTFAILKIPMAKELNWSDSTLAGGYAVMMILYGITAFFSGMVIDRWGAKPCYFLAAIFGFVSLWVTAGVHEFQTYLLVYGLLGGIATGMCWVSSTVSVRKWYVGKDYAKMWGFAFAGAPMAQVLLSLLCGQLVPLYGWRVTARVLAAISLIVMLLATILSKKGPEAYGAKPFGELPVADGKKKEEEHVWGVGEAWSTYAVWGVTIFFFLCAISEFLVWTQAVSFFVTDAGYSLSTSVNLYMIIGVVGIFSMPIMGMFADRLVAKFGNEAKGRKTNLILCPLVGILACIMILLTEHSMIFAVISCILFPIYWAMMPGGCVGYAGAIFGRKTLGKIWGIATLLAISTGPALGSFIGGVLRDWTGGVRASMLFAIVPFIVAAIVAITLPLVVIPHQAQRPVPKLVESEG
jgi:MFS transporter, OFA family, oxalate/formate antiporter